MSEEIANQLKEGILNKDNKKFDNIEDNLKKWKPDELLELLKKDFNAKKYERHKVWKVLVKMDTTCIRVEHDGKYYFFEIGDECKYFRYRIVKKKKRPREDDDDQKPKAKKQKT